MKYICEQCSKEFQAPPCQHARFCNRKCYDKSREGIFKCDNCKKEFRYYKSHKKGKLIYCSAKCQIEHMQGKRHPNWRGGKRIESGYMSIFISRGKKMKEHRYIMEKYLGRKLETSEIIHHINHNKIDNRIENLMILTRSEHRRIHPPR